MVSWNGLPEWLHGCDVQAEADVLAPLRRWQVQRIRRERGGGEVLLDARDIDDGAGIVRADERGLAVVERVGPATERMPLEPAEVRHAVQPEVSRP